MERLKPIMIQKRDRSVALYRDLDHSDITTKDQVLAPYYFWRGTPHRLEFELARSAGRAYDLSREDLLKCQEHPGDYFGEYNLKWKDLYGGDRSSGFNHGYN